MTTITAEVAQKVLHVVDAGLSHGLGRPVPGEMCVEAAVCFALGLPHGDDPGCVARPLRALKIRLNDAAWSSPAARAAGLRRLAVAQLGSKGALDEKEFLRRIADVAIRVCVPQALRAAADCHRDPSHKQRLLECAASCEKEGTPDSALIARKAANAANAAAAAYAANAAAAATDAVYAATDAVYDGTAAAAAAAAAIDAKVKACDKALSDFAEKVVQILVQLNAPGCAWLPLTELAPKGVDL